MFSKAKTLALAAVTAGAFGLVLAPTVSFAAQSGEQGKPAVTALQKSGAGPTKAQGNACGQYKSGTKEHTDCMKKQSSAAKPATPATPATPTKSGAATPASPATPATPSKKTN